MFYTYFSCLLAMSEARRVKRRPTPINCWICNRKFFPQNLGPHLNVCWINLTRDFFFENLGGYSDASLKYLRSELLKSQTNLNKELEAREAQALTIYQLQANINQLQGKL